MFTDLRVQERTHFLQAGKTCPTADRTLVGACVRFNKGHEAVDQGSPCDLNFCCHATPACVEKVGFNNRKVSRAYLQVSRSLARRLT